MAGIGETAELRHVRGPAAAAGFRIEDATGVEAEAEFTFAGLHRLCRPLLADPLSLSTRWTVTSRSANQATAPAQDRGGDGFVVADEPRLQPCPGLI